MSSVWDTSVSGDAGTVLASGLLPVLLVIGAAVAAFGEWSLPAWPVVLVSLTLAVALLAFLLHEGRWHVRDLRWLWVPIIIAVTSLRPLALVPCALASFSLALLGFSPIGVSC